MFSNRDHTAVSRPEGQQALGNDLGEPSVTGNLLRGRSIVRVETAAVTDKVRGRLDISLGQNLVIAQRILDWNRA